MKRSTEELRAQLIRYGRRRDDAIEELARCNHGLGALLTEARDEHRVTLTKAARIAGVSRPLAYKLMRQVGGSDDG